MALPTPSPYSTVTSSPPLQSRTTSHQCLHERAGHELHASLQMGWPLAQIPQDRARRTSQAYPDPCWETNNFNSATCEVRRTGLPPSMQMSSINRASHVLVSSITFASFLLETCGRYCIGSHCPTFLFPCIQSECTSTEQHSLDRHHQFACQALVKWQLDGVCVSAVQAFGLGESNCAAACVSSQSKSASILSQLPILKDCCRRSRGTVASDHLPQVPHKTTGHCRF